MVTKELLDFLSAEHEAGMSREEMERLLVSEGGWDKGDVEEALAELHIASAVPLDASTPPVPPVQEISVAPTLRTVAFEPGIIQSAAVPEEKVLQVIHGPKEPVHEDFLGILEPSAGSSQKEPAVPPALDELLAPVSMPEEKAPAPVALAPVIESKPVAAQPAESTFKFNLAAINGDDTVKEAPAAAQAAPIMQPAQPATKPEPALPKEIKTSSGAEMWLSSAGQKSDGSQQTTEAQKMTEEAKYPPRSSVRSMNQDILLRGRGSSVPGMPAMVAPMTEDEKLMSQTPEQKAKIQKDKEIQDAKVAEQKAKEEMKRNKPVESDEVKKSRVKKIISTAIGVVVLLALVVGAFTLFSSVRGPDIPTLLSGAITNFISAQSFAYSGTASSGIVLSAATDGVMRSGDVGFALAINGELKNGPDGFGDGTHHARFVGGLHSGEYNWTTDVESDFRMIGNILYFHVLSYPTQSNLDPEVFKTYWIKIDVPEIVKELALTSGATADDYGTLAGGGDRATDFFAILSKDMPWKGGAKVGTEKIGGVDTVRIKLVVDKDKLFNLVADLYKKYSGRAFALDDDAALRFKDALAKTMVEVWVDPATNRLAKISLSGNYDDDIAGVHAKGPLSLSFEFSRMNAQVSVTQPQPLLTLDDLKMRMDDYKRLMTLRAADAAKVNVLGEIQSVLNEYYVVSGRYPAFLTDLRKSGAISSSTIPDALYKQIVYASYVNTGDYAKANKCSPKSKICALYHIGINIDDPTDPVLEGDRDIISDVRGADTGGCAGEHTTSCYDVVGTPEVPPSVATTTSAVGQ